MGRRQRRTVLPAAEPVLDQLKYEVAEDLGLLQEIEAKGWGDLTTRDAGRVGGEMVRRMIAAAEESLARERPQRSP
ncbi:MAG: alpha/beta-type small acid-soluble spore protein [Bacillota bacterium]|nr:alpha/beta-type small acid-soluble spore protein [Bacillota bacterium]